MLQNLQRFIAVYGLFFIPSLGYSVHPSSNPENAPLVGPGEYQDFRIERPTSTSKGNENWVRFSPSKEACGLDRLEFKIRSGNFSKIQILDKSLKVIKTATIINSGHYILSNLDFPANLESEYFIKVVGQPQENSGARGPVNYDVDYSQQENCDLKKLYYLHETQENSISSNLNHLVTFNLRPRANLWFHTEVKFPMLALEGFEIATYETSWTSEPFNIEIISDIGKVLARKLMLNPNKENRFKLFLAKKEKGHKKAYIRYFSYSNTTIPIFSMTVYPIYEKILSQEEQQNLKRCGKITTCPSRSPLVIDFHNNSISLSGPSGAVYFDLKGEGTKSWYNWLTAGTDDSFIALDLDHNGTIDNGKELFGIGTVLANEGVRALNGFIALEQYDKSHLGGNHDGVIDKKDNIFSQLILWNDSNADGISQANELSLLRDQVSSIDLWPLYLPTMDSNGNRIDLHSSVKGLQMQSFSLKDVDFNKY